MDNDFNRNADSNLNCRSGDNNNCSSSNVYRTTTGGGGEGDTLRFSSRLVSDVEENYYQTIRTPQQADKKAAASTRHNQQLADYQAVLGSPATTSSSRLSDYQTVDSPVAAGRGQQLHQRLFNSPRRSDGPQLPSSAPSNIPVLLSRPWTSASHPPVAASGQSVAAASPRRATTAGDQRNNNGQQQQLVSAVAATTAAALRPQQQQLLSGGEGRIYGTGGSDKTAYRGPVASYNPVNRNMYNLQTGRSSQLSSPSR
jgi:hypothetical protein